MILHHLTMLFIEQYRLDLYMLLYRRQLQAFYSAVAMPIAWVDRGHFPYFLKWRFCGFPYFFGVDIFVLMHTVFIG